MLRNKSLIIQDVYFPVFLAATIVISLLNIKLGGLFCTLLFTFSFALYFKFKPAFHYGFQYLPFFAYVILNILFIYLSHDLTIGLKRLERQLSVLLMPLTVFMFIDSVKKVILVVKTYLLGLVSVSLVSLVVLMSFYITKYEFVHSMDSNYLQWKYPHLMGIHPSYWSYFIVVANCMLLYINLGTKKRYVIIGHIILNLTLFYLSSRSAIVINILIYIIYFAKALRVSFNNFSWKRVILFGTIVFALFYFFSQSPYFKNKIQKATIVNDERFFLWDLSWEIIKENYYVLGEGIGMGQVELRKSISEKLGEDRRQEYTGFDVHNQYIYAYLDYGLFGVVSIVFIVCSPLIFVRRKNDYFYFGLSLFILFFLSQFVESVFLRFQGKVLYSFVYPLLFILARKNYNEGRGVV